MRIDFNKEMMDLEGKPLKDGDEIIKLKKICVNSLLANDDKIDGTEKLKRFQLASKISKGTMDISVEDITLIKSMVGKYFSTIIVGQVYEYFENK